MITEILFYTLRCEQMYCLALNIWSKIRDRSYINCTVGRLGNFRVLFPPRTGLRCSPPRSFHPLDPVLFVLFYLKSEINRALSFVQSKAGVTQSLPVSFAGPLRAGYPSAAASGLLPRDVSFSKRSCSKDTRKINLSVEIPEQVNSLYRRSRYFLFSLRLPLLCPSAKFSRGSRVLRIMIRTR